MRSKGWVIVHDTILAIIEEIDAITAIALARSIADALVLSPDISYS